MVDRLLVGNRSLVSTIAQSLQDLPGTLRVATTDEAMAKALREGGIAVDCFDSIDATALSGSDDPNLVGVFGQSENESVTLARAGREAFPDAQIVVCNGNSARRSQGSEELERIADSVLFTGSVIADHVFERVENAGQRLRQLQRVLRSIDKLAIMAHDNPDPDAIASGLALARIAKRAGCSAQLCYFGEITHQENRAFINVLDVELCNLEPGDDLAEFDGIALVDHSRPGINDQLPPETPIDIVIDHHPPRSPVEATFVDLRSNVGATSTLLVEYLDLLDEEIETEVATALLFGIHVDTHSFSREISRQDFDAAARLVPTADFGILERIESPSISARTYETIARAIAYRHQEGEVLFSCVGRLPERDALAQAADQLLALEGVSTVLVSGIKDGQIYISARGRGSEIDLGEALRDAFSRIGSAGGHVDMAGAQIELGVLREIEDDDESLREIVDTHVTTRFFDVLSTRPDPVLDEQYVTGSAIDDEYLTDDETLTPEDLLALTEKNRSTEADNE